MARGRCRKTLPWVAQFATNLCRENGDTLLPNAGVKNLCPVLLTASLSDNLGKPFGKVTVLGDDRTHDGVDMVFLRTFRQGLWSAPRSRSLCRLCLCEAKRPTFLAKRQTFAPKHKGHWEAMRTLSSRPFCS